jgi:IS30 family transposase
MIKKEQKYKIIRSEIPIDETKPIIKKEKKEIINLTEIKELFKKPDYALLSKHKLKKKLEEENKALKTKDIDDFYDKLEINQLTKVQKKKVFNSVIAYYPGDCYQMDIIVYNKYEIHKYKYILVVIDVYSRYVQVKPLTNRENLNIIKNLLSIFETMGFPYRLQSDNEFKTKEFIDLMAKYNVKLSFSDPNEINKNATVERANRTIRDLLKKYRLLYKNYNWPTYIDDLIDIYNNTYHKTIGDTPYNIWNNLIYNQQTIIQKPVEFKIGDMVRIVKVKELFGKADEIIHSKQIYKVMKKNKNNITLDNGYSYKPYELIKANDIIYLDNNDDKKEELENQIFQKEQKIKRELKKVGVEEKNIIDVKRERKAINRLDL